MHHAKGYFWIFPWFGTEELCISCHNKLRKKDFGQICRCGSKDVIRNGFRYGKQMLLCNNCGLIYSTRRT
jgi:hypothetical protein